MTHAIDLRDMPYMPLHIERLRRSKAWLLCKRRPDLAFPMLNLWMAAWHGFPCGSLEDDDDILADAAMCDLRKWAKMKAEVMRGWSKGDDGRLYHPVIAELAEDTWKKRAKWREKKQRQREGQSGGQAEGQRGETPLGVVSRVGEGEAIASPRKPKSKPRSALSPDWQIPEDWLADTAAEYPAMDVLAEAKRFANYHRAKGNLMASCGKRPDAKRNGFIDALGDLARSDPRPGEPWHGGLDRAEPGDDD
jgi:uncharacterized protein YdaU (DUF1376 family)